MSRNGQFVALSSSTLSMPLFADYDEVETISGRLVVNRTIYDGAAAAGIIPRWVRSTPTFWVGPIEYVLVSTRGGPDPNPMPVFFDQPIDRFQVAGLHSHFFAWAEPNEYVSYQWFKNGKPIPGATNFTLFLFNCSKEYEGRYAVRANIGTAVAMSRTATFTLLYPVSIRTELRSASVRTGRSVALRVKADGTRPLSYHWFRNGQRLTNTTSPRLVIRRVSAADAGTYSVTVSNWFSSATSTATVTVTP
jgi:beta-galactosidase